MLAILRNYLEASLKRSGRAGEDLVFGRAADDAFYPSTIDHRAKRAWKLANDAAAEREGEDARLLERITLNE